MKQKCLNTILGIYFAISLFALFPASDNLLSLCVWETCATINFLLARYLCYKYFVFNPEYGKM